VKSGHYVWGKPKVRGRGVEIRQRLTGGVKRGTYLAGKRKGTSGKICGQYAQITGKRGKKWFANVLRNGISRGRMCLYVFPKKKKRGIGGDRGLKNNGR